MSIERFKYLRTLFHGRIYGKFQRLGCKHHLLPLRKVVRSKKKMYQFDQKPSTVFSDQAQQFLEEIKRSSYAVLCGRNNCGKSFILKKLTLTLGESASYLGPARYQNFNVLGYFTPNRNRRSDRWRNFLYQWQDQTQNIDNSPLNLQQAIAELNDDKRDQLIEIMEKLLGSKMEIRSTVSDNSMSQKYISVDGHNISFTSSGYRLIATLVTSLLDEEYNTFLIDEPVVRNKS